MSILVFAALASSLGDGITAEIVYMPEGSHTITPWVDGKPKTITVHVPAARGPASALPKSFRYEPGKGIMVAVEWTGAGKAAVEGKDFSYLYPTFLIGEDGTPDGLPARGPLASLLNEPAFREIPRIAALDAHFVPGFQKSEQPIKIHAHR